MFQIRDFAVQGRLSREANCPRGPNDGLRMLLTYGRYEEVLVLSGAGRMATALARGCVNAGLVAAERVLASDPIEAARGKFAADVPGARATADNAAVLAGADVVVLAVKPQMMAGGPRRASAPPSSRGTCSISIAAGVTLARLAAALPPGRGWSA